MGNKHGWTPERRAKQAEAIRRWHPWESSTGPRSDAGKRKSARNATRSDNALLQALKFAITKRAALDAASLGYSKLGSSASSRPEPCYILRVTEAKGRMEALEQEFKEAWQAVADANSTAD